MAFFSGFGKADAKATIAAMTTDVNQPTRWVRQHAGRISAGARVLDLAAGRGRNTRYFLARGHPVTAVDIDVSGLADIADAPRLEIVAADLEGAPWPLGGRRFAGVVVTNYLWRPLLRSIVAAVDRGGVLIYDTFALGNARFGKPSNPDFLLRPNELLQAAGAALTVLAYRHGPVRTPRPAIRQMIVARRDSDAG